MRTRDWLETGFDYTNASLACPDDEYLFERELAAGAQGRILQFKNPHGRKGVFKHFVPGEQSTRAGDQDPYWPQVNERDVLSYLTIHKKADIIRQELHGDEPRGYPARGEPGFVPPGAYARAGATLNHELFPHKRHFPLILEWVTGVGRDGTSYKPLLEPPQGPIRSEFVYPAGALESALLMEYCPGEDLRTAQRHYDPETLFLSLVESLADLHHYGIIHRDLKPENIIVTEDDGPLCQLIDFGIAQFFELSDRVARHAGRDDEPSFTNSESQRNAISRYAYGSRLYSAPTEQLPSNRDDIFSLGILGCTLFSGAHPLTGLTEDAYHALSPHERKELHRHIGTLIERAPSDRDARTELERRIESSHAPPEVRRLASIDPEERPARMYTAAKELGVTLPDPGPSIDFKEYPHMETHYNADYEGLVDRLVDRGVRVLSAWDYTGDITTPRTESLEKELERAQLIIDSTIESDQE